LLINSVEYLIKKIFTFMKKSTGFSLSCNEIKSLSVLKVMMALKKPSGIK